MSTYADVETIFCQFFDEPVEVLGSAEVSVFSWHKKSWKKSFVGFVGLLRTVTNEHLDDMEVGRNSYRLAFISIDGSTLLQQHSLSARCKYTALNHRFHTLHKRYKRLGISFEDYEEAGTFLDVATAAVVKLRSLATGGGKGRLRLGSITKLLRSPRGGNGSSSSSLVPNVPTPKPATSLAPAVSVPKKKKPKRQVPQKPLPPVPTLKDEHKRILRQSGVTRSDLMHTATRAFLLNTLSQVDADMEGEAAALPPPSVEEEEEEKDAESKAEEEDVQPLLAVPKNRLQGLNLVRSLSKQLVIVRSQANISPVDDDQWDEEDLEDILATAPEDEDDSDEEEEEEGEEELEER